jgi:hypothetical protein
MVIVSSEQSLVYGACASNVKQQAGKPLRVARRLSLIAGFPSHLL